MTNSSLALLMPTFNSCTQSSRRTGRPLIENALASLLSQTYTDFQLIILDNRSSDETVPLVLRYASQDPRIQIHVDEMRCGPEEAIGKLTHMHNAEFSMIVNDDDLWAPNYIETLYATAINHDSKLTYSNGSYLNMNDKKLKPLIPPLSLYYSDEYSRWENFSNYLMARNPFPITFGLWDSKFLRDNYPTELFDSYRANLDNLFIANVLRKTNQIKCINNPMFFYRNKPRTFSYDEAFSDAASNADSVETFLRLALHHVRFARQVWLDYNLDPNGKFGGEIGDLQVLQAIALSLAQSIIRMETWVLGSRFAKRREFKTIRHLTTPIRLMGIDRAELTYPNPPSSFSPQSYLNLQLAVINDCELSTATSDSMRSELQSILSGTDNII